MSFEQVKIGEVCDVLPGFAFKSKDLGDQGTPVLKIGSITDDYRVSLEGIQKLPNELLEKRHQKYQLRNHDILIAMTGATAGKVGRIRAKDDQIFLLNQRVARLIPKEIDSEFFWFIISTPDYRRRFYSLGGGAAQPNMSGPQIASVGIPNPPLPIQKRIASILSAYDYLIENNRRRIALMEEAARLLYREWFVRFRFPGYEHAKIINGVPEGWQVATLGSVAKTNPESFKKSGLPDVLNYVDISSVSKGRIEQKTTMFAEDAPGRARRIAKHKDVIWSNVRPNLRAYSMVLNPEKNDVFSTGFTVLRASDIPASFLYFSVTTDAFVGHLVNHSTGVSYPAVRPDDFERADIQIPPESLTTEFDDFCTPVFRQIDLLQLAAIEAAKARDLLLPRLMDGSLEI